MDPDFISSKLCMEAEIKWKVGDERRTPKGRKLTGKYDTTYCVFELEPPKNMTLADFLIYSNSKLYKHKEFLKSIRNSGGTLEYYIAWIVNGNSGELFDLKLLMQLVDLGIELGFEMYSKVKK
jgi:hypothetical protein